MFNLAENGKFCTDALQTKGIIEIENYDGHKMIKGKTYN